jgi:hypothetical protein
MCCMSGDGVNPASTLNHTSLYTHIHPSPPPHPHTHTRTHTGETYSLRLQAFKPNKALSLKLTPADGVTFTTVGALVTGANGAQTWKWTVPQGIKPGTGLFCFV